MFIAWVSLFQEIENMSWRGKLEDTLPPLLSLWDQIDVMHACRCASLSYARFDVEAEAVIMVAMAERAGQSIASAADDVEIRPHQLDWLRQQTRQGRDPSAQMGVERMSSVRLKVAAEMRRLGRLANGRSKKDD